MYKDNYSKNEKNILLKINNTDKIPKKIKHLFKFTCYKNTKVPACKWSQKKNLVNDINLNDYNYGIPCGDNNNLWVLDIDEKDNGIVKFLEYLKKFGQLNTFTVKSPNNGNHYYFKFKHSNNIFNSIIHQQLTTTTKIGGYGIDIRSVGSYIIGPGSVINNKYYEITNNIEISEIPETLIYWLLPFITEKKEIINSCIKNKKTVHNTANFKYIIDDDKIKEIFDKIDKSFIEELYPWTIFTSICKSLNKFDIWDKYSKKTKKGNYNYEQNVLMWNNNNLSCDINLFCHIYNFNFIPKLKVMIHDKINISKKKKINEQYLDLNINIFKKYDKIIIKSCTGTGKTTNISKNLNLLIKENCQLKVLSIVNFISLSTQQIKTFNKNGISLVNYQDANEYEIVNNHSVICINSLIKLKNIEPSFFKNTIVYIDEIHSLIETITHNDSLNPNLKSTLTILFNIIANCHKIIVSDATITHNITTLLNKKVTNKEIFITNKFKRFEKTNAHKINDENEFLNMLINDVTNGNFFSLACDNCEKATLFYNKLTDKLINVLNLKIVLITGDTKIKYGDIKDPENTFIIYSPSINTGVDINLIKKTTQYIHITGVSVNSISLYQMSTRTRNQNKLVYFSTVKERKLKYNSLNECRQYFRNINNMNDKLINVSSVMNENDEIKTIENTFFQLYTYNEYQNDVLNTNLTLHFENILIDAGFNIIKDDNNVKILNKDTSKKLKQELKDTNEKKFNYNIEHFDELNINDSKFKKNCDMLGIINTEQAIKFKFFIENEHRINSFFNFQKLMKNEQFIKEQYDKNKINNFNIKTNTDVVTKILLLRQFEKKMNINKLDIQMNNFDINKITKLSNDEIKHFQNIFRTTKTEINTFKQIQKFYVGLIKNICGVFNIIISKTTTKNNKAYIIYSFNYQLINSCFELIKLKDEQLTNYDDTILKHINIIKQTKNYNNKFDF